MPIFKTTEDNGHWHLIYTDPNRPNFAVTSLDRGHRHTLAMPQPEAQQLPEAPGQTPQGPGTPTIIPYSDPRTGKEHGHLLTMDPVAENEFNLEDFFEDPGGEKIPGNEAEEMTKVLELFRQARAEGSVSRDEAKRANQYRKGDQWQQEDVDALQEAGRPVLTLNLIAPMLDLLSGYARQNRVDWKWFPVEASDSGSADLFNIISKHVAKKSNLESEEIDVFDEGVCGGRSFFEVIPDFTKNPLGEVKVSHFPSRNVYLLPHIKKDLSDCEGLFKFRDVSLADAKSMFPDKAAKFEALFQSPVDTEDAAEDADGDMQLIESPDGYGATTAVGMVDPALYRDTVVDIGRKTIRLGEFERREYRQAHFLLVPGEISAVEVSPEVARKAATLAPVMRVLDTQASRIRVTYFAGPYLIRDRYPMNPFNEFSLIPFYVKKDEEEYWGKVRDVFDCQDEVNKRRSQAMDILNKVAAYGYLYDDDTFDSKKDAAHFDANAASPGFRCKVKSTAKPPLKMEGAKFPAEVYQMEQASVQMFHMISNVNTQMLGQAQAKESGFAKQIQVRQAMLGNEFLFDNFLLAKRQAGRLAMGWAKVIYAPERVARIVLARAGKMSAEEGPMKIGGQEVDPQTADNQYWTQQIAHLWVTADLMDYDLEIGEGALSPTARQAVFSQWLEAAKTGVTVPPEILIDYSDLPNKNRYLKLMKEAQERAMAMEEKRTEAELLKARGGAPFPATTLATSKAAMQGEGRFRQGRTNVPPGPRPGEPG